MRLTFYFVANPGAVGAEQCGIIRLEASLTKLIETHKLKQQKFSKIEGNN